MFLVYLKKMTMYGWFICPITGFYIGTWLDDQETLRMSSFRDKSALFGKPKGPGDPPSWP